ncbi:MAG: DUF2752 domain-containing protein [Myxococcaceae bacterium]
MSSVSPSAVEVAGQAPGRKGWSSKALLSAPARYLALAVMLASAVFPVHGLGFDLCALHATTGLPCPGCGMSRALSAFTQGDFTAALGLNPFVLVVWPTFVLLAVVTLLPRPLYRRFEGWVLARDASIARVYRLVVYAFIVFGVARFAAFAAMGQPFP